MYSLTIQKKKKKKKQHWYYNVAEEEVKKNSYRCNYVTAHNNNKIQI